MPSPDELAAIVEIQQLACRYAAALDACDAERFMAVFWPDAQVSLFLPDAETPLSIASGPAELAAIPEGARGRFRRTSHEITSHVVDLDGERARGALACTARHLVEDADHVAVIRYHDRYERRGGAWKILAREIRLLWIEVHPASTERRSFRPILGGRPVSPPGAC